MRNELPEKSGFDQVRRASRFRRVGPRRSLAFPAHRFSVHGIAVDSVLNRGLSASADCAMDWWGSDCGGVDETVRRNRRMQAGTIWPGVGVLTWGIATTGRLNRKLARNPSLASSLMCNG